jgi:Ca2+-binding RTX toxin-like protein
MTPALIENGQTTEIGTVKPGISTAVLALQQIGGAGTVALKAVNGVEEIIYTAPANVGAGILDAVSYKITDQYNDMATGSVMVPVAPSADAVYLGTAGGTLNLANGNAAIDGRAGNENIKAGNGADVVFAGPNDKISLGNGNDTVTGTAASINAGNGNDNLTGSSTSVITAGNGNDNISGGNVTAGNGNDVVTAAGNVSVGTGKDTVIGTGVGNTITVGSGNDTIYAGVGDTINLGRGNDTVAFGLSPGAAAPLGAEIVSGFGSKDVIDFNPSLFNSYGAVVSAMKQSGPDTLIAVPNSTDTITLTHVAMSSLTATNFKFG